MADVRWTIVVTPQGHLRIHRGSCPHTDRSMERILLEEDRQLVEEVREAEAKNRRISYCKNCLTDWPGPVRHLMARRG
ncbi:MAG TPA: hypothetical protein VIL95_07730 [Bacillota bacterium]